VNEYSENLHHLPGAGSPASQDFFRVRGVSPEAVHTLVMVAYAFVRQVVARSAAEEQFTRREVEFAGEAWRGILPVTERAAKEPANPKPQSSRLERYGLLKGVL